MNLKKKKKLATRVLKVGIDRISFNEERLDEIKEAITNQDIRDLVKSKAIIIKPKKGRRKINKSKSKRGFGKIKKKIRKRKENYIKLTRKLRRHLKNLRKMKKVSQKDYKTIRKQIRNKTFRSKSHLNEMLGQQQPQWKLKIIFKHVRN